MPKVRKPAERARKVALCLRTTDALRARIEDQANVSGRSMTTEVEALIVKALDAEALEATLRRAVREEIAGLGLTVEGDLQRHVRMQQELAHKQAMMQSLGFKRTFSDYVPDEDAIAVMARAQQ